MKKIFTIIILLILSAIAAKAQRASLINDTARYNGIAYTIGDTLRLGNGSQQDKSFAFISMGNRQAGLTDLENVYANTNAVIEKIFIQRKTIYINAKLIDKTANTVATDKILIDLEPAIDNREIK